MGFFDKLTNTQNDEQVKIEKLEIKTNKNKIQFLFNDNNIILYSIKIRSLIDTTTFTYMVVYRVDEDRVWFYKFENDICISSHHTKNGIKDSIDIIKGIDERYIIIDSHFNASMRNSYDEDKEVVRRWQELKFNDNYNLEDIDPKLFNILNTLIKKPEDFRKRNPNNRGFLLEKEED